MKKLVRNIIILFSMTIVLSLSAFPVCAAEKTETDKASKSVEISKYLNKSYKKLVKKVPAAVALSKYEDPTGTGNIYVFKNADGISLFLRYDVKTKKISVLQNDQNKKLLIYGARLGLKTAKVKAAMKAAKCRYVKKEKFTSGYWLNYKKGKGTIRLRIESGKLTCFQWIRS